ncbi:MAG TPA: hypothetical protein VHZ54_14190 [Solirubrobacterales bacterium]|jgi:hypothetical protein|nr:hypothetical protein [Solirubrobacterales bacterium]
MLEPIMWRVVALHPSPIPISDLIRELAGDEEDRDQPGRRDAVLRAVADAVRVGLLEESYGSVVATEDAMFVNQFIDNEYAPPLEGEMARVRDAVIRIGEEALGRNGIRTFQRAPGRRR